MFCGRSGQGRTLVLNDGILCDGYVWKYLVEALRGDYEIVHWHYPGHGKSAEPPRFADLSPLRLSDDVKTVIDHVGAERAVIVGHSLGVQVALETWHRHRSSVEALVLICGSPGQLIHSFHESAMLGVVLPIFDLLERFVPRLVLRVWKQLPAEQLLWLAKQLGEVNPRLTNSADLAQYLTRINRVEFNVGLRMLKSAGQHDATPYLTQIDVPVLIIAGQNDRFTPPARSEMMAAQIPQSKLIMARGGTHILPVERPDFVNLQITRFLETLG